MKLRLLIALCALAFCTVAVQFASPAAAQGTQPRLAVLAFESKINDQFWLHTGSSETQDAFITELTNSGHFVVVGRDEVAAKMAGTGLSPSGTLNSSIAVHLGKLLNVHYLLIGTVTELGTASSGSSGSVLGPLKGSNLVAALNASLVDTSNGKVVWADQASGAEPGAAASVSGPAVNESAAFDKVVKPAIQKLAASLNAAEQTPTTTVAASPPAATSTPVTTQAPAATRGVQQSAATPSATALTQFTVSSSDLNVRLGRRVALIASAMPASATGTVTFYDGGTPICTDIALSNGYAKCRAEFASAGDHVIKAKYNGSAAFAPTTSLPVFVSATDKKSRAHGQH